MGTEENKEGANVDKLKYFFEKNRGKWNGSDGADGDEYSNEGINLKAVKDPFEDSDEVSEEEGACKPSRSKQNNFAFENLRMEQYNLPMLDMEGHEHGIILNKDDQQDPELIEESNVEESKTQEVQNTYEKLETQKILTNEDDTQKLEHQLLRQELTQGNQLFLKAVYGQEPKSALEIETEGSTYEIKGKERQIILDKESFGESAKFAATQVISSNEKNSQSTNIETQMIGPSYDDENDMSLEQADRSSFNKILSQNNEGSEHIKGEINKTSLGTRTESSSHKTPNDYKSGGDSSVSKIQDTTGDLSTQWFTNTLSSRHAPPTLELKNAQKSLVVMSSEYTDKRLPLTQVVFSSASNGTREANLPTQKMTQPDQEEDISGIIIESPELKLKSHFPQRQQSVEKEKEQENQKDYHFEQNDENELFSQQDERVEDQEEIVNGEVTIENKNALEQSSPLKASMVQKTPSRTLSRSNIFSTQESDEPIKTPNVHRVRNTLGNYESQSSQRKETEQEKTGIDVADKEVLNSNKAEETGKEVLQDHKRSIDCTSLVTDHSTRKPQAVSVQVASGSISQKDLTCNQTERNEAFKSFIYPTEILRKQNEKEKLNKQDIIFPESVWGFYDTNFMYYPGQVLSFQKHKNDSEAAVGIKFFGSFKKEYLKEESVKHMAIMIGDTVLLDKSEHRVTGLECRYPGDADVIRCIRGYDTILLRPCKGKNKKEISKLLSSITVDVTNWCKMQLRLGDNSIIENMDWSLLNRNFETDEQVARTPTKNYNLRKRTKTENFYEMSTQTTDSSQSDRYDESEISEDEEEVTTVNDIPEFKSRKKACRALSRLTKGTSPLKEEIPKILYRTTTQLVPPLSRTTSSRYSPIKKPQQRLSLVCPDKKLFAGCLFLFTGIDEVLKNRIAESIVKHAGIYIPNEISSVLNYNPTTDAMELDKNLENELGIGKIRFIALITDQYRRSIKYIEMLAMGLPILHYQFIFDCFQSGSLITDLSLWKYLMPAGELNFYNGQVKSYNIYKFYQNFIVSNNFSYLFQSSSINFKEHQQYKHFSIVLVIYGNSNFEHLISFLFQIFHVANIVKIQSSTTMENKLLECLGQFSDESTSLELPTRYLVYQDNLLSNFKDKHDFVESMGFKALMSVVQFERLIEKTDIVDKEMVIQSVIGDDFKADFEPLAP
ncbi:hypothetical protein ACO0RG_002659 [Hanseniaspora osmophila]